jgi:AraC-like DNA-binding protein
MSATRVHFYDGNRAYLDASHTSAGGVVRSIRHTAQPPLTVDMDDIVGLTVQASSSFRSTRKSGRHYYSDAAQLGRAFLDRPGERWSLAVDGECRIMQFRLSRDAFEAILLEDHDEPGGVAAIDVIQGANDFELLRLIGCALAGRDGDREVMLRAIVARLASAHRQRRRQPRSRGLAPIRLRRVQDLVESDPTNVTLSAMAAEAGLSLYHFAREFRRETGQTPWAYAVQRRIWHAVDLLTAGTGSVGDIARRTGFVDASHLGRAFRKTFGASHRAAGAKLLP